MKRHTAYELIGQVIMVDPAIATKDESGKPGIIFSVSPGNRLAHIEYNNGIQTEYLIDKLITLAPKATIMQRLISNWEIKPNDFAIALKICRLVSERKFAKAMELAVTNDTTTSLCTISCTRWMTLQQNKKNNSHKGLSR